MTVMQRLLRSKFYLRTSTGVDGARRRDLTTGGAEDLIELSSIESLLGDAGSRVLLGFLTQPQEGKWFLEDMGSQIELNLSRAEPTSPVLFTQGSLIVVEGVLSEGIFHVYQIGAPPPEPREMTLQHMNVTDPFGNATRSDVIRQQADLEKESHDTTFIIISDIHLDQAQVLKNLNKVFSHYEDAGLSMDAQPPVFVLMGSFVSQTFTRVGGRATHLTAFQALADVIASHPFLASRARFILQPGPEDMGVGATLPRRRLPSMLRKALEAKVKHVSFVSNPFRIRFYTQELVFFREDILRKMQRNCALKTESDQPVDAYMDDGSFVAASSGEDSIFSKLAESILRQGHLLPLPLEARPVYWELDHSLRLDPLPHLLVLADRVDQYYYETEEAEGTKAVNPGSFSSDGSFMVYYPSSRSVEESRV